METDLGWAQIILRWIHFLAGITWIGLLYFFNLINGHVAKTFDAAAKKSVVPELMPRSLWWFRWGAAFTWLSGVALLMVLAKDKAYEVGSSMMSFDSPRLAWISIGALFGTVMAFNVWFIIWPAQKIIISAIKAGEAPPAHLAPRALLASRTNTYLSVPLLFTMTAGAHPNLIGGFSVGTALITIAVGLFIAWFAIGQSGKVGKLD